MFGKTLLSVISLLFASNLAFAGSITFKDIPECSDTYDSKSSCGDSGNAVSYCYKNKKLFGFSSSNSVAMSECDTILSLNPSRVNIVTLGDSITSNDLSAIASGTIGSVAIFDCDEDTCQRVTGIVKKSGENEYYYVGTGTLDDAIVNVVMDTTGETEYLVFDGTGSIAYKYQNTAQAKFTDENGNNVCVDGTSVIWSNRKEALCGAQSDCLYYYDCKDGVCTLSRKNNVIRGCEPATCTDDSCTQGYHLVGGNTLYYCNGVSGCGSALTGANIPIGYLKNEEGGYIECKYNSGVRECSAAVPTSSGCKTVGGLHTTSPGAIYNLCLDTSGDISVDLTTDEDADGDVDSEGKYIIALGSSTGLFGIAGRTDGTYYITVDVDDKGNVKVIKESNSVRYRYTATDSTTHTSSLYKIYDRTAAQTRTGSDEICDAGGAKPFEFKLVQWDVTPALNDDVDYYVEGENTDLS